MDATTWLLHDSKLRSNTKKPCFGFEEVLRSMNDNTVKYIATFQWVIINFDNISLGFIL